MIRSRRADLLDDVRHGRGWWRAAVFTTRTENDHFVQKLQASYVAISREYVQTFFPYLKNSPASLGVQSNFSELTSLSISVVPNIWLRTNIRNDCTAESGFSGSRLNRDFTVLVRPRVCAFSTEARVVVDSPLLALLALDAFEGFDPFVLHGRRCGWSGRSLEQSRSRLGFRRRKHFLLQSKKYRENPSKKARLQKRKIMMIASSSGEP